MTDRLGIVIVPAYNEEERVAEAVGTLRAALEEDTDEGWEWRIYVIDDGSTDATRDRALEASADRVLSHRFNEGLGAAVRTGLAAARHDDADLAVKFDADLQHDAHDIIALVEPIRSGEADVVYGNRFERIEYRMPIVRRVGNWVFTRLVRWLTGWPIRDAQPGILAVDRVYLDRFRLPGDYNYTQQILLDAYHKGLRFSHVPVAFRERKTGRSFISIKYPFKVLSQMFWVIVGVRPMRVFGTVGLLFMLVGIGLLGWDLIEYFRGNSGDPIDHGSGILLAGLIGLQTFFFGVLAQLIIDRDK